MGNCSSPESEAPREMKIRVIKDLAFFMNFRLNVFWISLSQSAVIITKGGRIISLSTLSDWGLYETAGFDT